MKCRTEMGCLKSYVGGFLKEFYPIRFPDRKAVKDFLAQAIEHGIVGESGKAQYKVLTLDGFDPSVETSNSPAILECSVSPISATSSSADVDPPLHHFHSLG
jgi:hypothetical protein